MEKNVSITERPHLSLPSAQFLQEPGSWGPIFGTFFPGKIPGKIPRKIFPPKMLGKIGIIR
jgi:hypothetical protein